MTDKPVRIFVSSPADVDHERAVVKDIIERLAGEYLPYFTLRAILWEEEALTADRTFQAGLTQPEDCDIVLVILWTRLGSPLPQEPYRGMTGTEWEFINAVEASAASGTPEVLVYKKTAPRLVDITDAAAAREAVEDRRRLEEFFRSHFFFEDNSFRRAFRTFDTSSAFRELVETQLRKLLNRRISAERRALAGSLHWHGSPFRADRPFDSSDERIFTGREQEVRQLLLRVQQLADADAGFLLITGPSGSGKTSLLRAGLLPRITRPFQFEEIARVRSCLIEPAAHPAGPIAALADALCDQAMLGEPLAGFGLDAAALARLLSTDAPLAAQQIGTAIATRSPAAGGAARLLIALDPLESLLQHGDQDHLHRFGAALDALARAPAVWVLGVLRSDALPDLAQLPALQPLIEAHGWIEVAAPADSRLRQIVEIPARVAGIDLDADATSERDLIEELEADASLLSVWPPLVQQALASAYQIAVQRAATNDAGELRLTAADYHAGGRIDAQVLARASALWGALDAAARAALPQLCRALITVEGGPDGRPANRFGSLSTLRRDAACSRLLDQLIAARLVIAEGRPEPALTSRCPPPEYRLRTEISAIWRQTRSDWRQRWRRLLRRPLDPSSAGRSSMPRVIAPVSSSASSPASSQHSPPAPADLSNASEQPSGTDRAEAGHWRTYRPVVSFSHPILMGAWAPVRDWLANPDNRRLLAQRFQLDRQAQLWKRTNCNREYLLREAGCADADALLAAYADELEPLELEFIEQSKAHLAFLQRRSRLVRMVGAVLAALMLLSALSAGLAYHAYTEAQANLSHSKLNEANLAITRGNSPQAVALTLSAGADLPQRAVQTLGLAFSNNRLIAMAPLVSPSADAPRTPGFSADGGLLASFLPGRGATLLELKQGRFAPIQALADPELGVHTLVFGAGKQVFGIGATGVWRLPAAAAAEPDYPCGAPAGPSFALDPQRHRLAFNRADDHGSQGVCVLDLTTPGRVLFEAPLEDGAIRGLGFSPNGDALLTASAQGRSRLIDLTAGEISLSLPSDGPLGRPFNRAIFDADGERIAIAAADERIRLYTRTGVPIAELSSARIGGQRYQIHRSAVRDIAFDPSGTFLVAADDEGQVVRWTLMETPRSEPSQGPALDQAVVLNNHRLSAGTVAIIEAPADSKLSDDLVLSASLDGTARLAGLQTGKGLAVLGHDAAVSSAGFHDGGHRVATLSVRDGSARLWSVEPVSRLAYRLSHPNHVWYVETAIAPPAIARSDDALLLATAGYDGGVRVWRYGRGDSSTSPQPWASFLTDRDENEQTQRPVRQVRFSPSGSRLASAQYDGTARLFDLIDKRTDCVLEASESSKGEVYNALFGPDGDWVLTTSDDPSEPVRLFSTATCARLATGQALHHEDGTVEAATVLGLDDRTLIATGDQAGIIRLIERSADGRWHQRCRAEAGVGAIGDLALSPDGRQLAIAGEADHAALIRLDQPAPTKPQRETAPPLLENAKTGCGPITELRGHSGRLYSIAFAPDAQQLVTASLDKTARLWSREGEPVAILEGHQDRIYRAEFSPDGDWVLTGSRDRSIRIWRRARTAGAKVQVISTFLPLEADAGGVANAVFSPDGHYVAGAYWEDAAILWRLWAEEADLPDRERADWGGDRSHLALVQEAYRFAQDNAVPDQDQNRLHPRE
ncbi:AAA family ATPase [Halochromatium glycolicum]|uniref:WD40 repeat n=1 Tax=Halochromatium glycolicum TaxID=85075 RepID=A0AAJ0U2E1_9GAMM|nr:AAA family ATPase [Halochromatium glycolicum]MBK1703572.1 hypothetical protein [Halochromatium glycolicum]